ncbi:MAG: cation-translocating P-type ATPase [Desulfovibrio sp.]|jgi:heavy metal translocating P-type ATPase|nr:cation-translocating P-type ATPase [Desulfovibrio sp.]
MDPLKECILNEEKRHVLSAVIGGIALAVSFFGSERTAFPCDPAWVAVVLCGIPIVRMALVGLFTRFDVKADVLVAIALVASVVSGEIFAAGEVAFIMSLGSLLEERTVRKAREGIEKMVNLTPRTAHVLRDGSEITLPAQEVRLGDILRVFPGETVPVDGIITSGQTAIDQSLMTGEALPVDRGVNDEVCSGTVNQLGAFDMRAVKVGEDSALQRMIRLVESADAEKSPVVRVMDRWSTWIVFAALAAALSTWAITGEAIRAVTILVVFCPCALVLATPTAIMAGIGNATRFGVLIAQGDTLERLAQVTLIAFDKTGTLTHGEPKVIAVIPLRFDISEDKLLALAAAVEQCSEHPLGKAVVRYAKEQGVTAAESEEFFMTPGRGIRVSIGGKAIWGGNLQWMRDSGIPLPDEAVKLSWQHQTAGHTVIYLGMDGGIIGLIILADTLRDDARTTIQTLHAEGAKTILLTGDHEESAKNIAGLVGITDIRAVLLPEDKAGIIGQELQGIAKEKVCMIGDGINDAPALKTAYVSLAMGGSGSGIAVEAADGVLVRDDIKTLPHLLRLAKKTVLTIKVNIFVSMLLNFTTVTLAATGFMGPVIGALAHNAGALLVVLNSARLLGFKEHANRVS